MLSLHSAQTSLCDKTNRLDVMKIINIASSPSRVPADCRCGGGRTIAGYGRYHPTRLTVYCEPPEETYIHTKYVKSAQ